MIRNRMDEARYLKGVACSLSTQQKEGRVQTSGNKDKISEYVARATDIEQTICGIIEKRNKIVSQVENIRDAEQYDILARIYIIHDDIGLVAIDNKMSWRQTYRRHLKALDTFAKLYGMDYLIEKETNVTKCQ